ALPSPNTRLAQPFPSASIVAPAQEEVTLPSPVAPVRPKQRRSPVLVGVLLLLILVLVAGGSIGVWSWRATATAQANSNATATAQTNRGATATAQANCNIPATAPVNTNLAGKIWLAQPSGTFQDLESVASSGTQFVAVGSSGTILTSP